MYVYSREYLYTVVHTLAHVLNPRKIGSYVNLHVYFPIKNHNKNMQVRDCEKGLITKRFENIRYFIKIYSFKKYLNLFRLDSFPIRPFWVPTMQVKVTSNL